MRDYRRLDKPQHAVQLHVSMAIRMMEKYGTDAMLCSSCKKAKLELLYVHNINGNKKEVQRE